MKPSLRLVNQSIFRMEVTPDHVFICTAERATEGAPLLAAVDLTE